MKAKGQPAKTGGGPAQRARFAHGVHVGQPLSAYMSTNSGEEEKRDEIMGPTASRPQSSKLLHPEILDFRGYLVPESLSLRPSHFGLPLQPPSATFTTNFLCIGSSFSLSVPSQ